MRNKPAKVRSTQIIKRLENSTESLDIIMKLLTAQLPIHWHEWGWDTSDKGVPPDGMSPALVRNGLIRSLLGWLLLIITAEREDGLEVINHQLEVKCESQRASLASLWGSYPPAARRRESRGAGPRCVCKCRGTWKRVNSQLSFHTVVELQWENCRCCWAPWTPRAHKTLNL